MSEEVENQTETVENTEEPKKEEKKFSRDDIAKMVNAQVDKIKNDLESKYSKQLEQAKVEALEEGERRAKMTADEKAEEDRKRRELEFERREKELELREQKAETRDLLTNAGLPLSFVNQLMGKDSEETQRNINEFQKIVNQQVQNELHKKAAGKVPNASSSSPAPQKKLSEMTLDEQMALYHENPQAFQVLQNNK
ncbi:DUF4355 domain-containing protein [Ligilactobacillus salivarius]|uniref:DUF4355 domain-containing protein n=1 Tax=Ligilactobacillus salivarius TaxID=1624 RepID=UPI001956A867|nr:DUF4355 domain-containing protein [Ligilactobacillus salivarius]MBM6707801.1 DUF4355 domain-containing protein [Ligilactobacillus salivarius]